MKLRKLQNKGFTIVELLIVIVIIGILATIGFVSFASAQNKAKKSKAQATVAQVKSKLGEYYSDKNSYPETKADLTTWMNANGAASTATEFNATGNPYTYDGTADGGASCTTAAADCTTFTLGATMAYWKGSSPDTDISVTP